MMAVGKMDVERPVTEGRYAVETGDGTAVEGSQGCAGPC